MAFNLIPNSSARYFADTGGRIGLDTTPRLGTPTGPTYTGAPLAPTLATPGVSRPVTPGANPSDQYSLLRKTKNPVIEAANNALLGRVGSTSAANQNDLAAYTAKLLGQQPRNDQALSQESSSIGDVFNGNLARQLAEARNKYAMGARQATANAIAAGEAARKSAAIGSGIGGSSYFARQAIAANNEAGANLAADLANREGADIRYVRDAQGRLVGVRNRLANENAAGLLLPTQARSGLLREDIGALGTAGQVDAQNNIYGVTDNNPNPVFNPANYPVGGGPMTYSSTTPGGQFFGRVNGAGGYTSRDNGISRLLMQFANQQPTRTGTGGVEPPTHDYWNDPNYSLTPQGWVPNRPTPPPQITDQDLVDNGYYTDPNYMYDNSGAIERPA